jgi:hypothetical protein
MAPPCRSDREQLALQRHSTEICIGDQSALQSMMKTTLNLNDTLLTEAKALGF